MFFFFFKQKTAYEMRISDWSSDVCSSDLRGPGPGRHPNQIDGSPEVSWPTARRCQPVEPSFSHVACSPANVSGAGHHAEIVKRSEEHTSEIQSLMRISYDVFCLKNKKQQQTTQ